MSKKDFIAVGDMMRLTRPNPPDNVDQFITHYNQGRLDMWEQHRDALAAFFTITYPAFDRDRWLRYVNGGTA